ncbi:hypothetical protein PV328_008425 [Microctonus aethiopoides]|uniref:Nuclease HARBI1 n=1 Tax=Microctonus aethiopoides TaxID=144406 RepID=A0AA39KQW7_9HYME|nr:hypothetical protein PV328_008425 [Microctonus aethiopoides]
MAKLVLLEGMLSSSSSESDSDESIDSGSWDDIFEDDDENHHCYPLRPIPTVYNFMENVVARYTDTEFQRTTFYYLLNILKADMHNFNEFGHPPIAPEKQLCITLYVLGTPDSYRTITNLFGVGKATAWRTVLKVVKALGKFRNYFITWLTPLKAQETPNILEARYGFPGVIGMPARYQCRFFTSSLQCRNKGVYKNAAQLKLFRRLVFKTSKMTGLKTLRALVL